MGVAGFLQLSGLVQALPPILTDCLQHQQARLLPFWLALPQEALVDERGHAIEHRSRCVTLSKSSTGRFCRLERAATDKDGESLEEPLLVSI